MGAAPASLLPELEEVVQHGSAEKRAETLRRITGLFLDGAPAFRDEHVAVFDDVIGYLIEEIEAKALAEQDLASDSMAAQFAELDGGLEVEDDLQRLKARVQGGQQALPAGESTDELAALKARMGVREGAALSAGDAQSTGMASASNTASEQQAAGSGQPQTPPPGRQQ